MTDYERASLMLQMNMASTLSLLLNKPRQESAAMNAQYSAAMEQTTQAITLVNKLLELEVQKQACLSEDGKLPEDQC